MTRTLTLIFALVCLGAAIGWSVFLYYDIMRAVAAVRSAQDAVSSLTARDTFSKNAARVLSETAAERSAIQFFLVPADGTADAIDLVEQAGKAAGVAAVVDAATLVPIEDTSFQHLEVSVSAEGTFAGMARFATVLESLPVGARLVELRLEATERAWRGIYLIRFIKHS